MGTSTLQLEGSEFCQQAELGRGSFPRSSDENSVQITPRCQPLIRSSHASVETSVLQNYELINRYSWMSLSLWKFVMQQSSSYLASSLKLAFTSLGTPTTTSPLLLHLIHIAVTMQVILYCSLFLAS